MNKKQKEDEKDFTERLECYYDNIDFNDKTADTERITVLTKIQTLQDLLDSRIKMFEQCSEFQIAEMQAYAEWKSISDLMKRISDDVIRLDNRRISILENMAKVCRIFCKDSDKLSDRVKEYADY